MALIDNVKAALRITDPATATTASSARTSDIQAVIDAGLQELERNGWKVVAESDERVKTAVTLYCKGMLDYQNKGDRYMDLYREYITGTSLDTNYIGGDKNV